MASPATARVVICSLGVGLAAPSQAALDKVKDLGSTPRLAPGDYGDLVRAMKKILQKDSIVPVAAAAAEVAAVLAAGLRDAFSSHAKVGWAKARCMPQFRAALMWRSLA